MNELNQLRADNDAAKGENMDGNHLTALQKYHFTDEHGHLLENCTEFQALVAQIQNDVKAVCPSIPPAPTGDFHAEEETKWGMRTLDIFIDQDGDADVTLTTREDSVSLYLKPVDLVRLRDWLNGQEVVRDKARNVDTSHADSQSIGDFDEDTA